jgi:hypothetical protein
MAFDPCNRSLKIWESIETLTPKVGAHLGVWGFIPSHSPTLMGAWNVIPGLHSWPAPSQALALVASPRLGLWHLKPSTLKCSLPPNVLQEFTLNLRSLLWCHLSHSFMPCHHSHIAPFRFCVALNAYATYTWKTMHLVKFRHSNLPHYLGLTLTLRHVGIMPATNFPSGPRPCCLKLLTLVFRPNCKFCLV